VKTALPMPIDLNSFKYLGENDDLKNAYLLVSEWVELSKYDSENKISLSLLKSQDVRLRVLVEDTQAFTLRLTKDGQ
jgi:hypothetical protein